jgi:hypothetical protein
LIDSGSVILKRLFKHYEIQEKNLPIRPFPAVKIKIKKFLRIRVHHIRKPPSTKNQPNLKNRFFDFFSPKRKNQIFNKFSKSADFLYSGVFGYREHEFKRMFWFWPQERVEGEGLSLGVDFGIGLDLGLGLHRLNFNHRLKLRLRLRLKPRLRLTFRLKLRFKLKFKLRLKLRLIIS